MKNNAQRLKRLAVAPLAALAGLVATLLQGCRTPPMICDPVHEPDPSGREQPQPPAPGERR
jgi:hypothetical protein